MWVNGKIVRCMDMELLLGKKEKCIKASLNQTSSTDKESINGKMEKYTSEVGTKECSMEMGNL